MNQEELMKKFQEIYERSRKIGIAIDNRIKKNAAKKKPGF